MNPSKPISQKLLKGLRRFKGRKVIDFKQIASGARRAEELQRTVTSDEDLLKLDLAHGLYVYAQNQAAVLSEQLTGLPEMQKFVKLIGDAEDEYMPSGPPMSPLTTSYFICWALFDACIGKSRETIGTCIIELAPEIGLNPELLKLISMLQDSRMGFHILKGFEGSSAVLKEMVTGIERRAIVPSGHRGKEGEIWLARVLPPPIPGTSTHVVFTTPYAILWPGPDAWRAYFSRTLPRIDPSSEPGAYEELMKYGLDRRYWSEYIFEAYVNHKPEVIFLAGLPDVEESRPHSRVNS